MRMKTISLKFAALCLAVLLCCGALAAPASAEGGRETAFTDITDTETAQAASVLAAFGVVSGYGDGRFGPDDLLTRAQFAKMAIVLMGLEDQLLTASQKTLFSDVTSAHWAAAYVNLAYSKGLIQGYGNGYFGPDDNIAYEQAVTIALRILGYEAGDIGNYYPDDYLNFADRLDLTDSLDRLAGEAMTRGEAARLLYALLTCTTKTGGIYADKLAEKTVKDVILLDADTNSPDGILNAAKFYSAGQAVWYPRAGELDAGMVGSAGMALLDEDGYVIAFLPEETRYTVVDGILLSNNTRDSGRYAVKLYAEGGTVVYPRANTISANLVGCTGSLLLSENGYATAFISDDMATYDLTSDAVLLSNNAMSDTGVTGCAEFWVNGKSVYYKQESGSRLPNERVGQSGIILSDDSSVVLDFLPDGTAYTIKSGVYLGETSGYSPYGGSFYIGGRTVSYPITSRMSSQSGTSGRLLINETGYVTAFLADSSASYSMSTDAILLATGVTSDTGKSNCAEFLVNGKLVYYAVSYASGLSDRMIGQSGTVLFDDDSYVLDFIADGDTYDVFTGVYVETTSAGATFLVGSDSVTYPTAVSISSNQAGCSGRVVLNDAGYVTAFVADTSEKSSIITGAILISAYTTAGTTYGAKFYVDGKTVTYPYTTTTTTYPWYSGTAYPWYGTGYYYGYAPTYTTVNGSLSGYVGYSGTLLLDANGCISDFIPNGDYYRLITGVVVSSGTASGLGYFGGSYISIYTGGQTLQYMQSGSINAQSGASGILLVNTSGYAVAFIADSSGGSYSMSQSGVLLSTGEIAADGSTVLAKLYVNGNVTTYAVSGSISSDYIGRTGKLMLDASGCAVGFMPESGSTRSVTVTTASADTLTTESGSYSMRSSLPVISGGSVTTWGAAASTLTAGTALTIHFDSLGSISLIVIG